VKHVDRLEDALIALREQREQAMYQAIKREREVLQGILRECHAKLYRVEGAISALEWVNEVMAGHATAEEEKSPSNGSRPDGAAPRIPLSNTLPQASPTDGT